MSDSVEVDPEGFARRISQYTEWLKVNYFSEATAFSREKYLKGLVIWCADRGMTRPSEVTKLALERYQSHLYHYRKKNGEPLTLTSQRNHLTSIKGLFRWLARQNHILYNPASELLMPRLSKRLPKHVLTPSEAERVIAVPDAATPLGIRDRAILETLYSSGLRRMELVALKLYDLDRDRETLIIREGKGRRQRVVPIGRRALTWIEKYLAEVRPTLVVPPDEGYLFLTMRGGPFDVNSFTGLVRTHVQTSEIGKQGSVHLFRHTMATLMLEGGADVRFIQAMLGHSKLDTTAIYTQVAVRALKRVHSETHPAEGRRRKKRRSKESKAKLDDGTMEA